ncbi:hypothetical protein BpHYR1_010376 [Brachionus plicatilis]|uniref:BED-type domain-containing protein n=1 Tax=Brachionus plicatilis TaxID=10195 RepID=A0A3M7SVY8_BRAPC|nr:hypothetical protein BpHYR1_010376 [Brachionus plicatilis]
MDMYMCLASNYLGLIVRCVSFRKIFSALDLVPLKDVKAGWDIILDNIPIPLDEDILKFINYFVKNWLKEKYGTAWNHFENSRPRTNNHLEGYHSKLPSLPSAKTNNVLTFINMIKKSASQEQYNENVLTFAQYFDKLTSHIIDSYGINTLKYSEDHENEEKIDKVGQKRRRKIRVDFSNLVIKPDLCSFDLTLINFLMMASSNPLTKGSSIKIQPILQLGFSEVHSHTTDKNIVRRTAICNYCRKSISESGNNTSNFIRHLKKCDPETYTEYKNSVSPKLRTPCDKPLIFSFSSFCLPYRIVEKEDYSFLFRNKK